MKENFTLNVSQHQYKTLKLGSLRTVLLICIVLITVNFNYASSLVLQQSQVSGTVKDENGLALPGASVMIKGTRVGTVTDAYGRYALQISSANATLVFSFTGYKTQEVGIAGQTTMNISLVPDQSQLNEVVVTGYGTSRKRDLTGAVASVNIEDTRLQPNTNAVQILRGTTAGVQVTDNGRPGSSGTINIRGINSISASNTPLLVLDGIIYAGGSLADINPSDIESISVLKDASSTAIYGSLAANGVIEVTTKKGKLGKPVITFNTYHGTSDFANIPKYLNPEQYLAARADAVIADGGAVPFQPIEQENIAAGKTINPFEEIKQYAPIANYEMGVSGKTDKVNYYLSGSFADVKSAVIGDNFKRIAGRLNLGVQVTDWMRVGLNSGYSSRDDSGNRPSLEHVTYLSPYSSLYLEDGVSPRPQPMGIGLVPNPLTSTLLDNRLSVANTLFTNAYADVNIWKGLSYRLNTGYTKADAKTFIYRPSYAPLFRLGSGSKSNSETQNLTVENIVNYSKLFAAKHQINVTLLYGIYEFDTQSSSLSSNNIFNDALGYNSLEIGENFNINSGARDNKQTSNMARLNYSFNSKYFLTLSVRRDGYSAFGKGNKYGVFPAAALSWNASEENFLKGVDFLSFLKLRLSWGRNGSRGVNEYASLSDVEQSNYVFGDGAPTSIGLNTSSFANPNLGWETTESFNLGADFAVLNNRISSSINYYNSRTFDLLLNQRIPNTNGFEVFLRNIGRTKNWGVEIDLSSVNIRTDNFTWDTRVAFSFNRNEIVQLTGVDLNEDGIEDDDIASGWFIGQPLGSYFDYVFDGIYQEGDDLTLIPGARIGDIRFKDITGPDGIPDGRITPLDRRVVENNQPNYISGITNIFTYKGFSFSSTFNMLQGGVFPNTTLNPGTNFYDQANFLNTPYWTPDNPINTAPRINYRNPLAYRFYQDRSFVRLQDVSFAYSFPTALTKKMGIGSLQLYASGKNLLTWTDWKGWDPEFGAGGRDPGNNGPLLRTYTVGLNISL